MGDPRTTIVIFDRNEMARRGLRALFSSHPGLQVIGECATAPETAALVSRFLPDVVVVDPGLPDADGLDICEHVRAQAPRVRVVALLSRVEERVVVSAVRAGATGVMSKRAPLAEMCRAVRAVATGDAVLDGPSTSAYVRRQHVPAEAAETLTEIERRVLSLVAEGRTNKEISQTLSLGQKTVKTHLARAFTKLHVSRRAQAAVLFVSDERGADGGSRRRDMT
jgi:DNA-binding NarL/FixJ family response regulator